MDGFHGRGSQLIHPTEQHTDSEVIPGVEEEEECVLGVLLVVVVVVGGTNPEELG